MIVTSHLDYLQYSIPFKKEFEGGESIPPLRFYKIGVQAEDGTRYYFGNVKSGKTLVVKSGQTLTLQRNEGITDTQNLDWALSDGASFSRLDIAVNFYVGEDLILPEDFIDWSFKGLINSKHVKYGTKSITAHKDQEMHHETVYIGDIPKRHKKGIVRAYDKGVDLDIGKFLITRLELESRKKEAQIDARRIVEFGIIPTLKTRFDVNHERWLDAVNGAVAPRNRVSKESSTNKELEKRWDWLLMQVAPALGRAIREDLKESNYRRINAFQAAVWDEVKGVIVSRQANPFDPKIDL